MSTVAITIDGVLRKLVGLTPIPVGIQLYHALAAQFHVVLLSNDLASNIENRAFLDANQCYEHVKVIDVDLVERGLDQPALRVDQVNRARALGQNVQLVVEPNPAASAALVDAGYNVVTFTSVEYTVPSWRPDFAPEFNTEEGIQFAMPWDSLQQSVANQARLKAEDDRLREDKSSTNF